jgi:hypothetical protein
MGYCTIIYLPAHSEWEKAKSIFDKYGICADSVLNQNIASQIPDKSLTFNASYGSNERSVIGMISENLEGFRDSIKDIPLYTYGGWQTGVRGEWMEKYTVTDEKDIPADRKEELAKWNSCLKELFESGCTGKVGILKHFFTEKVEEESLLIRRSLQVNIKDIEESYLLYIEEDIAYEFIK